MSSSKEADDVNDVINAKMTSLCVQCPTVTFGIYLNTHLTHPKLRHFHIIEI